MTLNIYFNHNKVSAFCLKIKFYYCMKYYLIFTNKKFIIFYFMYSFQKRS